AVLKDAAEKIGVEVELEKVPEGADGDNLVKTRFATNDLPDLLFYYAGLNTQHGIGKPADILVSQDDQPWIANFDTNNWKGVMDAEGLFYGAPLGGISVGVVLYNKKVFESLNLKVPTTMEEFWAVSEAIKKGGKTPVFLSGKDSWTLQLPALISMARPSQIDFLKKLYAGEATYHDFTIQKKGLTFLKNVIDKGYVNKDFLSDTYDNAQKALAEGSAGMYVMATWVMPDISTKFPDQVNDIGAFIMPFDGTDSDVGGVFPPNAVYVVKGKNQEAAQRFLNYFASLEAQNLYFSVEGGIPAMKGVTQAKVTPAEADAQKMVDAGRIASFAYNLGPGYPIYAAGDFAAFSQDVAAGGKTPDEVMEAQQKEFVKNAKAANDPNFK
ncbi:MAG TPA: extracellular solute-binding protein, partial [Bacilli bacterium]